MTDQIKDVDKTAAFLIELLGGFFGFLGIGHFYAGLFTQGIVRLIGWWFFVACAWVFIAFMILLIIGLCMVPIMIILQFAVPIWSAISLKRKLDEAYPGK